MQNGPQRRHCVFLKGDNRSKERLWLPVILFFFQVLPKQTVWSESLTAGDHYSGLSVFYSSSLLSSTFCTEYSDCQPRLSVAIGNLFSSPNSACLPCDTSHIHLKKRKRESESTQKMTNDVTKKVTFYREKERRKKIVLRNNDGELELVLDEYCTLKKRDRFSNGQSAHYP